MSVFTILHAVSDWMVQSRAFNVVQSVTHHRTERDALSH